MCLAGCVGLNEGLSSNIFAVAFIVSLIVMYDASGVRLHAGKQAQVCALCPPLRPPPPHAHMPTVGTYTTRVAGRCRMPRACALLGAADLRALGAVQTCEH